MDLQKIQTEEGHIWIYAVCPHCKATCFAKRTDEVMEFLKHQKVKLSSGAKKKEKMKIQVSMF